MEAGAGWTRSCCLPSWAAKVSHQEAVHLVVWELLGLELRQGKPLGAKASGSQPLLRGGVFPSFTAWGLKTALGAVLTPGTRTSC